MFFVLFKEAHFKDLKITRAFATYFSIGIFI
jgi:hypothetical protein